MIYKYGYRLRGPSPGAQPKDFIRFETNTSKRDGYWGYVFYDRELTDKEIYNYDLDFIEEDWMTETIYLRRINSTLREIIKEKDIIIDDVVLHNRYLEEENKDLMKYKELYKSYRDRVDKGC